MSSVADMDILLEEEADKQRVVEEVELQQILAVARQARAEAERAAEAQERANLERQRAAAREQLVSLLSTSLSIVIPAERVGFYPEGDLWERPIVQFGGRTFSYHCIQRDDRVVVGVQCEKCRGQLWIRADSFAALLGALEEPHSHAVCPEPYDEYDDGSADAPMLVLSPAERYTAAIRRRRDLQFERAKVKELAVRRIITNKGVTFNGESFVAGSATAAEKLVEFDEGYAAHCAALTDAVIEEIAAREALRAAGGNPQREDEEM